jgi:hypothetical protein
MRPALLLAASLAASACATAVTPPIQPHTPRPITAVQCVQVDCRIGSNGTRLTGLAVGLAGAIRTIALSSGEVVALP